MSICLVFVCLFVRLQTDSVRQELLFASGTHSVCLKCPFAEQRVVLAAGLAECRAALGTFTVSQMG